MDHHPNKSAVSPQAFLANVRRLYEQYGAGRYESGKPDSVSQLEHALQCAMLAESAGADECLITAALFHDLGHLLYPDDDVEANSDDEHEVRALPVLAALFPESVLEPIRLHVKAKRYLCLIEPGYHDDLSVASKRSLELQGGVFDHEEGERFLDLPYAAEAVLLRRWDDLAKNKGLQTPSLDHFLGIVRGAMTIAESIAA